MDCPAPLEPCHVGECDGLNEVIALLPPGQIWQIDRAGVYTNYIRALGHIKTELNKQICAIWGEVNPCTANQLLPFWADFYGFPECLPLTQVSLCKWLTIVNDPGCPIGTLGFLQAAIDFVLPPINGLSQAKIAVNHTDYFGNSGHPESRCANGNTLVITGNPDIFRYQTRPNLSIFDSFDAQDGINGCRTYFIPEIECLRRCVFPLGLSVGYKTVTSGPNNVDIFGVPDTAQATRQPPYIICKELCSA